MGTNRFKKIRINSLKKGAIILIENDFMFKLDQNIKNNSDTCQLFSYNESFVEHDKYNSIRFTELQENV